MKTREDTKNNIINVTIFESNLSQFILEYSEFYRPLYIKLLDAIEHYIKLNRNDTMSQRFVSRMFFDLDKTYKNSGSFTELKNHFSLIPIFHCIKQCCDTLLRFQNTDKLQKTPVTPTLFGQAYQALYTNPGTGMNTLCKYLRPDILFSESNRGVKTLINKYDSGSENEAESGTEDEQSKTSKALGIVEDDFTPDHLKDYFKVPNECARFDYLPDYESYVANWLYQRNLPIISGTSGSIVQLFTRLLPLDSFSKEEIKLLLLVQTASLIAMGHHSFFECMLVADKYGYKLKETKTLIDFYLQCIPKALMDDSKFKQFIHSDNGEMLIADMALYRVEQPGWKIN